MWAAPLSFSAVKCTSLKWPVRSFWWRMIKNEIHNRYRIIQPVRMVLKARLDDHGDGAAQFFIAFLQDHGIFGIRHHLVGITAQVNDGYFCVRERFKIINGILGIARACASESK